MRLALPPRWKTTRGSGREHKNWKHLIRDFWKQFEPTLEMAEKEAFVPKVPTDIDCPKCGRKAPKSLV